MAVTFPHNVTFVLSGGSGGPDNMVVFSNYQNSFTFVVPDVIPTKDGYYCTGWAKTEGASLPYYYFGNTYYPNTENAILYAVWCYYYSEPVLTNVKISRSNSNGENLDTGTYVLINFDWNSGNNDGESSSITISWKKKNDTTYTNSASYSVTGKTGTFSSNIGSGQFDLAYLYDVKIEFVNYVNRLTKIIKQINSQYFIIDFLTGGKGVAFGKPATIPGLDINMDTYINGTLNMCGDIKSENTINTIVSNLIETSLTWNSNKYSAVVKVGWGSAYFSHYTNELEDNNIQVTPNESTFYKPIMTCGLKVVPITQDDPYCYLGVGSFRLTDDIDGLTLTKYNVTNIYDNTGTSYGTLLHTYLVAHDNFDIDLNVKQLRVNCTKLNDGSMQISTTGSECGLSFMNGETNYWVMGRGCGGVGNNFGIWDCVLNKLSLKIDGPSSDVIIFGGLKAYNGLELYPATNTAGHGGYIDFHYNQSSADYTTRIVEYEKSLYITTDKILELHARTSSTSRGLKVGCSDANIGLDIAPIDYGYCQVGNSSTPFYKMWSQNGYATTSDARMKNSIDDDLTPYVSMFSSLRPVKYKFNSDDSKYHIGFIAQEVEKALIDNKLTVNDFAGLSKDNIEDSKIDGIDDGVIYSLNYSEFISLIVSVVQDQQIKINEIQNKLNM